MRKNLPAYIWMPGLLIIGVIALIIVPTSFFESTRTVCIFKNVFGTNCPGCGMTRAVSSVFHGDLAGAFRSNRLVAIVLPLLFYVCIKAINTAQKNRL